MFGLLMLLTSCGGTGPALDRDSICAGQKPILVGEDDIISEATAKLILAGNRNGAENGCWKVGGGSVG
jgi:hypothetical protein